ncbi:MAG TPA: hypothetical protein VGA30_07325 [Actinomycetota bacterium]
MRSHAAESARVEQAKRNLGHARGAYLASMAEIYAACHGVLRPPAASTG